MKTFDPELQDTAAALDAGQTLGARYGEVRQVTDEDLPFALVPDANGGKLESLERFLSTPAVRRQTVATRTPAAFCAYLLAFALKAQTRIFWWEPTLKVTGILDYHSVDDHMHHGAGLHRVNFTATATQDWTDWKGIDKQMLDQTTFAQFIEDHLDTIAEPAGASLLDMATTFAVGRSLAFRSAVKLNAGTMQLTYDEQDAASGNVSIPTQLTLMVAPFEGTEPRPVKVRLRYKVGQGDQAGKLTLGIVIVRPQDVVRQAFADLVDAIRLDAGVVAADVPVIEGDLTGTFFGTTRD